MGVARAGADETGWYLEQWAQYCLGLCDELPGERQPARLVLMSSPGTAEAGADEQQLEKIKEGRGSLTMISRYSSAASMYTRWLPWAWVATGPRDGWVVVVGVPRTTQQSLGR